MPGRKSRLPGGPLLAALLPSGAAPASTAGPAATATAGGIPSVGTSWGAPGPYEVDVDIEAVHTFYRPRAMGAAGERHPVVIWGNGTGAVPGIHSSPLRHRASHVVIVAAADTPASNLAISMRAGIDVPERRNADPGSEYSGRVDLEHIGSAGPEPGMPQRPSRASSHWRTSGVTGSVMSANSSCFLRNLAT